MRGLKITAGMTQKNKSPRNLTTAVEREKSTQNQLIYTDLSTKQKHLLLKSLLVRILEILDSVLIR